MISLNRNALLRFRPGQFQLTGPIISREFLISGQKTSAIFDDRPHIDGNAEKQKCITKLS
jgi:hypothetical protein